MADAAAGGGGALPFFAGGGGGEHNLQYLRELAARPCSRDGLNLLAGRLAVYTSDVAEAYLQAAAKHLGSVLSSAAGNGSGGINIDDSGSAQVLEVLQVRY